MYFVMPLHRTLVIRRRKALPFPRKATYTRILLTKRRNKSGTNAMFTKLNVTTFCGFLTSKVRLFPDRVKRTFGGCDKTRVNVRILPTLNNMKCVYKPGVSDCVFTNNALD